MPTTIVDDEIDPETVADLLDDRDVAIVDIRTAEAFAEGHLPGSHNVPFEVLSRTAGEFDDAERIVTVCPRGEASVRAARLLAAAGLDARIESMAGGLTAYDGPLETGGSPGDDDPAAPF